MSDPWWLKVFAWWFILYIPYKIIKLIWQATTPKGPPPGKTTFEQLRDKRLR